MTRTSSSLSRSLAALALAIGLGAVSACAGSSEPSGTTTTPVAEGGASAAITYDDDAAPTSLTYPGRDGATVLELLREFDPQAIVQGEGENAFVTGIDGREADQAAQQFWALYVDGEFSDVGAGVRETQDGEVIEWKLETWE